MTSISNNSGMKKAIVIGATSGIGREIALLLAKNGYKVGATGRRSELLNDLARQSGCAIHTAAFDIAAPDALTRLNELIHTLNGLDLLLFSSGTGHLNPELSPEKETETNRLNVDAFTRIIDRVYAHFAQQGTGHIAVLTSVMGLRGSGMAPAYAASKAYQINYLEGLQQKAAREKSGIAVTDLRPGSMDTAMMKGDGHFWISSPEQAAQVILRAIRKKKRVQYVTPRWRFIGSLLKISPKFIHRKMQ